jgi:23S rRNA pseudouridine1911/1915/1917 synthase
VKRARDPALPAIPIAHRDAHLLVLIKPPGLPTTAPDAHTDCLARRARDLDPDAPKMHPSSRLDRDVTGLVTFARTTLGIDALLEARREGRYHRTYLALVAGALETATGAWDWSIAIDPRDRRLRRAIEPGAAGERAQIARSRWEQRASVGAASVLALHPETGRTHQLRVHCARAGHAILGDASYGGVPRVVLADGKVIAARRPMLHCARLVLPDVERGGVLDLRAGAPEDMARTWTSLGGDRAALSLP